MPHPTLSTDVASQYAERLKAPLTRAPPPLRGITAVQLAGRATWQESATMSNRMDERIAIDPEVQHGKPVVRGTRVPVARILGGLAGGMSEQEILQEYDVTEEDLRAVYQYAAELIEGEVVRPLRVPA